jgi:hypothetical protein
MAPNCLRKRVKWSWKIWWGSRVDRIPAKCSYADQISLGADLRVHQLDAETTRTITSRRGLRSEIKMQETKSAKESIAPNTNL